MKAAMADEFKIVLTRKERFLYLAKAVVFLVIFALGVVAGLWTATGPRRCCSTYTNILFPSTTVYRYRGGGGGSFSEFVAPTRLMHDMTDEQLFWRATMAPASSGGAYPFQRVPKVAFMFLAGRGILPLAPLWERFFRGHEGLFSIYVHAPPGMVLNVSDDSPFYGRQIPSQETSWGSITLMDAEKRLLANALLDFSNDRFVLLSESCIPVQSFPVAYGYLTGSRHSFVEVYYHKGKTCRGRYSRRMEPDITLPQWRKGSQWFELRRDLAVAALTDARYYPLFRRHCRPSCYPDEHYLPTFVAMLHGADNSNRTVTYVDWSRGGAHPATYTAGDVTPELILSIRRSEVPCMYNSRPTTACFLFARKFSADALEPLLNISSTVMQY
uniref:Uncharacterized protein n=1 Tax=Oryza glumipatula TaxID=40148 RepID=A0A0D9YI49_9ORYZ